MPLLCGVSLQFQHDWYHGSTVTISAERPRWYAQLAAQASILEEFGVSRPNQILGWRVVGSLGLLEILLYPNNVHVQTYEMGTLSKVATFQK